MYLDKQFEFCSSQDFAGRPGSVEYSQHFVDIGLYQDIRGARDGDHWATRMIARGEPIRILFNCEVAPTSGGVQVEVGMATDENGANWKTIGRSGRIFSATSEEATFEILGALELSRWAVGKSHVMILDPWSDTDRPNTQNTAAPRSNSGGERWSPARQHKFLGLRVRRLFGGGNTGWDATIADGDKTLTLDTADDFSFLGLAVAWEGEPITIHRGYDSGGTNVTGEFGDTGGLDAAPLETEIDVRTSTTEVELVDAADFNVDSDGSSAYESTSERVGAVFTVGLVDFTMSAYLIVGEQTGTNLSIGA